MEMGIKMSAVGFLAVVCLLATTYTGVASTSLQIDPSQPRIVMPGDNVTVMCKSDVKIIYCRFNVPPYSSALNLNPKIKTPEKDYAYAGLGLDSGDCGIQIFNIDDRFNGKYVCSVSGELDATESSASTTITVARVPKPPELTVSPSPSSRGSNDYREGDILQAYCVVKDARPPAQISWYIGDDQITSGIRNINDVDERTQLFTTRQNLTRKLSWQDNSRPFCCVVAHHTFGSTKNRTCKIFSVRYPPRDITQPIKMFGFTVGEMGNVVVTIQANPMPLLTWKIRNIELSEGDRDPSGKYESRQAEFIPATTTTTTNESDVYDQGQGRWRAVLHISDVTYEDTKIDYYLVAKNQEGQKMYRVTITTLSEPQAMLFSVGGIIGIVLSVLLLLLIIVLIIYARAAGRWCFAGGVPSHDARESFALWRSRSDTESAENGTLEKKKKNKPMTAFFKKKNDKVAADQDEVKTVPVDEEKDVAKEDSENPSSEGKKDIVYAELDLQVNRSPVVIRDDDRTEYAEILHARQEGSP